ncbi:MAG: hypothetical protein OEX12_00240 [Gammaproteobacteria bacterium]|nr:hypothetical protein [Gammaproteobacteria bacterium]
MKKSRKMLTAFCVAAMLIANVHAGQTLRIGTGSEAGTYFPLGNDIKDFCGGATSKELDVQVSGGAIDNLLGLIEKRYDAGIVQIDVLKFYETKIMPTKVNENRLKVVMGLHAESGHLLIPKGYKPSGGGFGSLLSSIGENIGVNDKKGISIDLIKGQEVAAWGGSTLSLKALSSFLKLGVKPVDIKKGQAVNMPILVIEGQPSSVVQGYLDSGKYTLVPIDPTSVSSVAPFYSATTLTYMSKGKQFSVKSFAVRAVLIGKASRKAERNVAFSELATCLSSSLEDLADDSATNPNWETIFELVDEGQINWGYFPLL